MKTWLEHFPHFCDPVGGHPALVGVLDECPRDEAELAFARLVDEAPKVEVHVHAEAAVPASFYRALAPERPPLPATPFLDFGDFLRRWLDNLACLRRPQDYAALGRAFVADRAARRIVHTECHVSPLDTSCYRPRIDPSLPALSLPESVAHFAAGLRDGMAAAGGAVRVRAVVDLVHVATPEDLDAAYAALAPFVGSADNRGPDGARIVVGIGLGGPERPDRAPFFAQALLRFRDLGLKLDLHSGEQRHVSPEDHAQAVRTLRPDRVGHGIRGAAAGFFFDGPLAACPLSNVLLRCHDGPLHTHPIAEMVRRGLDVSINTDDPLLLGTNLVLEYVALRRAFGFDASFFAETQRRARGQLLAP
jgi:adenosine deaminase